MISGFGRTSPGSLGFCSPQIVRGKENVKWCWAWTPRMWVWGILLWSWGRGGGYFMDYNALHKFPFWLEARTTLCVVSLGPWKESISVWPVTSGDLWGPMQAFPKSMWHRGEGMRLLLRWFAGHGDSRPSLGCQPGMKKVYTWGCHGEVGRWARFSDKEANPWVSQKSGGSFKSVGTEKEPSFFFSFICIYFLLNLFLCHEFSFLQFLLGHLLLLCTLFFWLWNSLLLSSGDCLRVAGKLMCGVMQPRAP